MTARPDTAPATLPWQRVFYWQVRRELWENRAIVIAPAAIAVMGFLGFLISAFGLPEALRAVAAGGKRPALLLGPYSFVALAVLATGLLVGVFYATGALQGERRDRSLLFWKSMPVSDRMTVLSKAAMPMLVIPLVTLAVTLGAQALMLAWSTLTAIANGISPVLLWRHVNLTTMWVVLPYGLLVNVFWMAPVWSWLLLVSAWARRMPILWALGPFAAPAIVEGIAFRTSHVAQFVGERLLGGYAMAFSVGGKAEQAIDSPRQLDPLHVLAQPDLWIGLLFAAAFLTAAIWLRRRREPA